MTGPVRIQRRRTAGWRMCNVASDPRSLVVAEFRADLLTGQLTGQLPRISVQEVVDNLAGLDLLCWCPLDQPCHADVLLEMANR